MRKVFALALCVVVAPALADAQPSGGEIDTHVTCMADKQIANAMLRSCERWHAAVVGIMIENWREAGELENVRATFARHGYDDLRDLRINPYNCLILGALLDGNTQTQQDVQARVEARRSALTDMHALPEFGSQDATEEDVCAAIDLALENRTPLTEHFQEYGLE